MRTYPCHGTPLCFHFACIQKKESAHVNLKHSKGVMLGAVGSLACGVLKKRASCVVALSTFRCGPYDGLVMSFGDAHHPTEAEFFIEKTMSDDMMTAPQNSVESMKGTCFFDNDNDFFSRHAVSSPTVLKSQIRMLIPTLKPVIFLHFRLNMLHKTLKRELHFRCSVAIHFADHFIFKLLDEALLAIGCLTLRGNALAPIVNWVSEKVT